MFSDLDRLKVSAMFASEESGILRAQNGWWSIFTEDVVYRGAWRMIFAQGARRRFEPREVRV